MERILKSALVIVLILVLGSAGALAQKPIPEYWMEELDRGAMEINMAMAQAGSEKSAFLFYSDLHWTWTHCPEVAPRLLKYLYDHTGMTKTFFGGDIVSRESEDYAEMAYLWDWRSEVKELPNHHSLVGNHDDGNTNNNLFTEEYVYSYLLAPEETPDTVYGEGLYYYIDNAAEKTRYLCLDTAFQFIHDNDEEQAFVKNALLTTPDGWHIVVLSHIWYENVEENGVLTERLFYGIDKYLLNVFDAYNRREGEFASCGGRIEFCIGGHTHRDFVGWSEGGIPVILVETASTVVRSGLDFEAKTTGESSVNGIIADYKAGVVNVVRVGRGEGWDVPLCPAE